MAYSCLVHLRCEAELSRQPNRAYFSPSATAAYALDGFAYAGNRSWTSSGTSLNRFIDSLKGERFYLELSRDNCIGVYNFPVTNFFG